MSLDRRAFNPYGPTIKVAGATTAPDGVPIVSSGSYQARVYNDGAETAFVAYGADAATAKANAVIPTGSGASSKNSIPLPPGAIEVLSVPQNSYFSAITTTTNCSVYVTPGSGV